MQKNGTVSQNLTMMKPAIAIRAFQKGSSRGMDIFYTRAEVLSVLTLEFLKNLHVLLLGKRIIDTVRIRSLQLQNGN